MLFISLIFARKRKQHAQKLYPRDDKTTAKNTQTTERKGATKLINYLVGKNDRDKMRRFDNIILDL